MTTTQHTIKLEGTPPEKKTPLRDELRFDWIISVFSALLIGGVWLDNWAHTHGKVDNTFLDGFNRPGGYHWPVAQLLAAPAVRVCGAHAQ